VLNYKFNWRSFKEKKVRLITAQFLFRYDPEVNKFRVSNDGNRYTVSELAWVYLDEFKAYNFILKDIMFVELPECREKPLQAKTEYLFDVSEEGTFVSFRVILNGSSWGSLKLIRS